ncbi:MAG: tautomerase family protein [Rickettsiaceae bacterium]|nr:tautomerase family protein [Rickettsiaceae bacterium]
MPIINIDIMAGRTLDQKRKLVESVTKAVCESIGTSPEHVKIKLNDMEPESYAISGTLIADQEDPFGKKKL